MTGTVPSEVQPAGSPPGPPAAVRPAAPLDALEAPPPPVDAGEDPELEPDPLGDGPAVGVVVDEPPGGTAGDAGDAVTG